MIKHLACIMDGNRRWAMKQGLTSWFGHKKGLETVHHVIDFCLQKKILYLSLYAFSIENLQRSSAEQRYLFEILAQEALQDIEELKSKNICIKFIGNRDLFPESVIPVCKKIESETMLGTSLHVNFLLCYGGQQEIVAATKSIAVKIAQGELHPADITQEVFESFLWTARAPSPDLVIRTGGDRRLSNFLLFQCAYSEFYFLDCLWPDISFLDLDSALTYFTTCRKNFGK
ncbi:MAG TPA: polyprenyl diphosphate synthase [Candidatus Babeliales bacterium]|nr:polyprenyl diphosphate synthase [Candidatus Babeliales bacterium]